MERDIKERSDNEKAERERRGDRRGVCESGRGAREAGVKNTKAPAVPNSITQTSRNIARLFDQLI